MYTSGGWLNIMTQGVSAWTWRAGRQLQSSRMLDKLRGAAESEDCRRLGEQLGGEKLAAAARSGDTRQLQQLLREILSTEEGRRLAGAVKDAMK